MKKFDQKKNSLEKELKKAKGQRKVVLHELSLGREYYGTDIR